MTRPDEVLEEFHLYDRSRPIGEPVERWHPLTCILFWVALGIGSWAVAFWIGRAIAQAAYDAAQFCGAC